MKNIKTVRELKEFIKDLPDDTLLVNYQCDLEKCGYFNTASFDIVKMKKETKQTWDRFDGCDYTYEVFARANDSEDGVICLKVD